jgi:hypothetical protein
LLPIVEIFKKLQYSNFNVPILDPFPAYMNPPPRDPVCLISIADTFLNYKRKEKNGSKRKKNTTNRVGKVLEVIIMNM